jgi:myo-inositol 2-dehydrogenase / D-chiro-inositol 1-dehydrogenase
VDAVVITTTSAAHHAAILAAAAAGKHVFVEKPLALTVEESLECVAACKAAGVILQVGFMRRFDTDIRRVRDLVTQGAVGSPHIVRVRSFDGIKQPTPYYATSGGIFMDCTIHDIDTARYIAGSEIVEVHTTATANDQGFADFDDVDTVLVALKFANGAIGSIENSRFAAYGHDTQAEVFGEKGKVHCGPNHADSVVLATKDGVSVCKLQSYSALDIIVPLANEGPYSNYILCFMRRAHDGHVSCPRATLRIHIRFGDGSVYS